MKSKEQTMVDLHYLKLLSKDFPNIGVATTEIINLNAILSLPKGTEYFLSDLHGENEAFIHMVKSASGVIRLRIEELFQSKLSFEDRESLAALIYDAESEIARKKKEKIDFEEWCKISILRLIDVTRSVSTKYTRSKVRKRINQDFSYIMEELINADDENNRAHYYAEIINSIIDCGVAERFIKGMTESISRLAVDRLHIVGDIWDRGSHPDKIMDYLMDFHDVDFQWGNHDIVWMGAAAGNWSCIANVIRMNVSYNNFDMLEFGYGINLRALSEFAAEVYNDDPCEGFTPHDIYKNDFDPIDFSLASKIHKAISVIQFKVEGLTIQSHPEYNLDHRRLLHKIDFDKGVIEIDGNTYELRNNNFVTVDPDSPYELTEAEHALMHTLEASFLTSTRLQNHIKFMLNKGDLYKCVNGNLLYHGCIPMTEDGEFKKCEINGKKASGKDYFDLIDSEVRKAFFEYKTNKERAINCDLMWYLWLSEDSPLFGKDKMTTFERCFIADKAAHKENNIPYYRLIKDEKYCDKILKEFGLNPDTSHIITGHMPVKIKDGDSPVRGNGKLYVIDGGMSKAYQKTTGIAGYTLVFNSWQLLLAEHKPYSPKDEDGKQEFHSPKMTVMEKMKDRITVRDSDIGEELEEQLNELKQLVEAYRKGEIKEI